MRLLNVHTRQLKSFIGSERPPYAILSHTWGDDEVEFVDLATPKWTEKKGFQKVDLMCKQAAKVTPKLDWVWIDTLCINKESSSELSEAINSMFAWYTDAAVCYAYLEDVVAGGVAGGIASTLPKAKWFTRGWTLQELLAPRRVEFFGMGWTSLGVKDTESPEITSFMTSLALITEIDEIVLWKPAYMRVKSIAARMSWASKRETTRKEDLAYCLMGLFDVNMPLLYGEGDRAFLRLQEEIIRISDDHSIFAWDRALSGAPSVSCFAASPSLFRRGSLVVPFGRRRTAVSPYSLTNQGLQISLPIIQKSNNKGKDVTYGLLNCHWENTLTEWYVDPLRSSFSLYNCERLYSHLEVLTQSLSIGVPLQKTSSPQVFERSPLRDPEIIALEVMIKATLSSIFLSTKPQVELPFSAEVSLQIYDNKLVDQWYFAHVEVVAPINSSYHWHPDYGNFRLRWLASTKNKSIEQVRLSWLHDKLGGNGLVLQLDCCVGDHVNSVGAFSVQGMKFISGRARPSRPISTCPGGFMAEVYHSEVLGGSDDEPTHFIRATLSSKDIFGNEVYTLKLAVHEEPKK